MLKLAKIEKVGLREVWEHEFQWGTTHRHDGRPIS